MLNIIDHVHLSADGTKLVILDQRRLPLHREYLVLARAEQMYDAVKTLAVRGAPAIGIFAGFAMYVLSLKMPGERPEFDAEFEKAWASAFSAGSSSLTGRAGSAATTPRIRFSAQLKFTAVGREELR